MRAVASALQSIPNHFNCGRASQACVPRQVDFAHAARAQAFKDFVGAECRTNFQKLSTRLGALQRSGLCEGTNLSLSQSVGQRGSLAPGYFLRTG